MWCTLSSTCYSLRKASRERVSGIDHLRTLRILIEISAESPMGSEVQRVSALTLTPLFLIKIDATEALAEADHAPVSDEVGINKGF